MCSSDLVEGRRVRRERDGERVLALCGGADRHGDERRERQDQKAGEPMLHGVSSFDIARGRERPEDRAVTLHHAGGGVEAHGSRHRSLSAVQARVTSGGLAYGRDARIRPAVGASRARPARGTP